ncbi:MAG: hypothetical protein P9X26_03980 [Candidatus Stygibacter frigidus]|nr:hypothetical protein [Candidatus Stygibacter frigidus]
MEGVVYRTKRNGEQEKYPYDPQSYYQPTPLTIRNQRITRFACRVTNPNESDYAIGVRKLFYYTPYIMPVGDWKFGSETVLYVSEWGEYKLVWNGSEKLESQYNFIHCNNKDYIIAINLLSDPEVIIYVKK